MSQQINQTNDISPVPEFSQPTIAYSTFQSNNTYSTLEEEVVSLREEEVTKQKKEEALRKKEATKQKKEEALRIKEAAKQKKQIAKKKD
ncbi:13896_t:CDS:2 [Dentiscutata heterogama]|uniref:13896_t:CDS:1 n=1 Tax=Dentiscutata heterogama TaxID=1316150 RepID=A0ACA9KPY6_9GLOM|nr:13896_t:CDS:2 [Dentiscutata heterogama]